MSFLEKIDYLESLIDDIKREGVLAPALYYHSHNNDEWLTEEEIDLDIKECEGMLEYIYNEKF